MKTALKQIWSYALLALAGVALMTSCNNDPETESHNISVDTDEVNVTSLGRTYDVGANPSVIVTSNVYWVLELINNSGTEEVDWIDTGGISAGSNSTELVFIVAPNDGAARSATIRFIAKDGTYADFKINQADRSETLTIYADDMGETAVTSNVDVNIYSEWNKTGFGVTSSNSDFRYSGTNAEVSADTPSGSGDASAGNNIVLNGAGIFNIEGIRPGQAKDFEMSFNAINEAGAFNADELYLLVSANNVDWVRLSYTESIATAWGDCTVDFSTDKTYSLLYFRFQSTTGKYRIDDVSLVFGSPSSNVISLPEVITDEGWEDDVEGEEYSKSPIEWLFNATNMDAVTGIGYKQTFEGSQYIMAQDDDPARMEFRVNQLPVSDPNYVDRSEIVFSVGSTGHPFATNTLAGDYWLWKVPVESIGPGSSVNINFITRPSANGPKYFMLEYYDYDEHAWMPAATLLTAVEDGVTQYTHQNAMQSSATNITVDETFTFTSGFSNKYIWIRYKVVGKWNPAGTAMAMFTGTHRIAGAVGTSPTIRIDDTAAIPDEINFEVTGIEDDVVLLSGDGITPATFNLKVNYKWTIEAPEWLTVTPAEGTSDVDTEISVTASTNREETSRMGKITVMSNGQPYDIIVVQAPAGSSEETGAIFFDNFNWVVDPASSDFDVFTNDGGTDGKRFDLWPNDLPAVAANNPGWTSAATRIYARPGYIKFGTSSAAGDITSPALEKITGQQDIFVSFKALVYRADLNTVKVSVAEGGGTIVGTDTFAVGDKWVDNKYQTWYSVGFRVNGADAATKIKIEATQASGNRFFLDDFLVVEYSGQGVGGGQVDQGDPMIDFANSVSSANVTDAGDRIAIRLAANVDIDIMDISDSWITEYVPAPTPAPGRNRAPVATSVRYFDIAPNAGTESRVGTITFKNTAASLEKVFTVYQDGTNVQSVTGLPAKWKFWGVSGGGFMDAYKTHFSTADGGNQLWANMDDGTNANTSAYISYVQRDDTSNDTSAAFTRVVGSTGQPYVTGAWPGDYWYYYVPVKNLPAGAKVKITFITRVSGSGQKFWSLEYKDNGIWKPVTATTSHTVGSGATLQTFDYTHAQLNNANLTISETATFSEAIDDGAIEFRFRCVANAQASNETPLAKPNGGTGRISSTSDGAGSPVIELVTE